MPRASWATRSPRSRSTSRSSRPTSARRCCRAGRWSRPRPARDCVEHAEPILLRLDAARADVARVAAGPPEALRIGTTPLAAGFAAALVAPALTVTVRVASRDAIARGGGERRARRRLRRRRRRGQRPAAAPGDRAARRRVPRGAAARSPTPVCARGSDPLASRARARARRLEDLVDARWIDAPAICAPLDELAAIARADGFRAGAALRRRRRRRAARARRRGPRPRAAPASRARRPSRAPALRPATGASHGTPAHRGIATPAGSGPPIEPRTRARKDAGMAVVDQADRSLPLGRVSPRQVIVLVVASVVMVAGLVVIAPALADLPDVWSKLADGHARMARLRPRARSAVLRRPRDPVPGRLGRGRGHTYRAAREHRDHARRPRRDAPARQRRRGRHRADGVGAEALGHGVARRRGADDDVHGPALQRLHGRAAARRARPLHGRDRRRRLVRDDDRAGDLRRRRDRDRRGRPARAAGREPPASLALPRRRRRPRRAAA